MACLLKFQSSESKGVVTLTTQEWKAVSMDPSAMKALERLREEFVTGLHFNWHDYSFKPSRMFDFFMAGREDLRPIDDSPFRLLPMDACNFTPECYRPEANENKFWDILSVGNPVFFKRPEVVLRTIRKLFDKSVRPLRVLYICPIPPSAVSDQTTVLYGVRQYYESLFSTEERERFTLLTTTFDSPNPFDRETLSVFFRNSRVFLHCATEERRCRIAAYAWCAGLPVVAYPSVASIVSEKLRRAPGFFEVNHDDEYVPQLCEALSSFHNFDAAPFRSELSETATVNALKSQLQLVFGELDIPFEGELLSRNLDRRLGWHHQGIGGRTNGLQQSLTVFMNSLIGQSLPYTIKLRASQERYPERFLAGEIDSVNHDRVLSIEKRSIYLNPVKRRWFNYLKYLGSKLFGG